MLRESYWTAFDRACEGLLLCVRSKVIENIVPLLENSVTTVVICAYKALSPLLRVGLDEFGGHEISPLGNMNIRPQMRKIHISDVLEHNFATSWELKFSSD